MNKFLAGAVTSFLLLIASFTSHARFTQADTWPGIDQQPVTLHKYAYANVDPTNHIDPSGNAGLVSGFGAGTINATLTATANTAIQAIVVTMGAATIYDSLADRSRRWGMWDVVAMSRFNANVSAQSIAAATTRTRSPDGHHTIPIYLCGSQIQQLSYIDRSRHAALHTGLAAVQVALHSAEKAADQLMPLTRRRSGHVMSLAETEQGRGVIASAIQGYYTSAGWWGQGSPTIATVFPQERQAFVGGKTSLPECKRTR